MNLIALIFVQNKEYANSLGIAQPPALGRFIIWPVDAGECADRGLWQKTPG